MRGNNLARFTNPSKFEVDDEYDEYASKVIKDHEHVKQLTIGRRVLEAQQVVYAS